MERMERSFAVELGRRLATAREASGRTQAEASEALGVARSAIAQFESGKQRVPVFHCVRLAQFYGVAIDEILPSVESPGDSRDRERQVLRGAPQTVRDALEKIKNMAGHEGETRR